MVATIDIPEELYRGLARRADQEGATLEEVIVRVLAERSAEPVLPGPRVQVPLFRTGEPGSLALTNADIDDFLSS